jgi:hypothetical protein
LTVLLSKTHAALRPAGVEGRGELRLALPQGAWIDVEAALEAVHWAESAVALGRWQEAWGRPWWPGSWPPAGSSPATTHPGSRPGGGWPRSSRSPTTNGAAERQAAPGATW